MPSRNIARQDAPDSYYHVYARGASKAKVFLDASDKDYFLYLLARHLSLKPISSKQGYPYPHLRNKIELLAYCLLDNHFHLLFYQAEQGALTQLMKSVMTAYCAYFNRKYRRTGSVFESRFKSVRIHGDEYLLHISRYIHLNPRSWKHFPHSSLLAIRQGSEPEWLQTDRLLAQHLGRAEYLAFVADYEANKVMLDQIKRQLANL